MSFKSDISCPFEAPSKKTPDVHIVYNTESTQPLQPHIPTGDEGNYNESSHPHGGSGEALLPFSYPLRCAVYSVTLVLSLLAFVFTIIMLSTQDYTTIDQNSDMAYQNTTSAANFTGNRTRRVRVRTISGNIWAYDCTYSVGKVTPAVDPTVTLVPYDVYSVCVATPEGMATAGGVTAFALVLSLAICVLSCVVLGLLRCQRRRAGDYALDEQAEKHARQSQSRVAEASAAAAADGGLLFVVGHDPSAVEYARTVKDTATLRSEQIVYDARVRQALGITCLVASVICLVMSILGLVAGLATEWEVKDVVSDINDKYSPYIQTSYDAVIQSSAVWPSIFNLVIFVITSLMFCVPALSGIADYRAGSAKKPTPLTGRTEPVQTVLSGEEEMQTAVEARE